MQHDSDAEWPSDDDESLQRNEISSSEEDGSQAVILGTRSQLRPAGSGLSFIPYANWNPGHSYEGERFLRWNVEWRIVVRNREQAGESEPNLVISPRKFWEHVLQPKVATAITGKPWKQSESKLILSVTDRKTSNIRKTWQDGIDWAFVKKQLNEWSHLVLEGKKITIKATLNYVHDGTEAAKQGRMGATAIQEADLEARTTGLNVGTCTKKAYALMRCPGVPCTNKSDHCWQNEGKHYALRPHHVRMLRDHLLAGRPLNGHDDVPEDFRRLVKADEQERRERQEKERSQKRKRSDQDGFWPGLRGLQCQTCLPDSGAGGVGLTTPRMVFPTSPVVELAMPREDAVLAYTDWHRSQVRSDEQKQAFSMAQDLTLEHGYCLNVVAVNQDRMHRFYTQQGVLDGVAWHFVARARHFLQRLRDEQTS